MSRTGDFYENVVTGERAVVLRGEEAPGAGVLVHLAVAPGGAVVGEHVHPGITERFLVLGGTLGTRIDGVERELTAGEEATVPPTVPHDWWNAGTGRADVIVEISPPDPRFEMLIATLFGLANAGRTRPDGMPGLLQAALIGTEFSDVIRFTSPPAAVQKVAFGVLGAIARARGLRGVYPEYLHVHGHVDPDPAALAAAGLPAPAAA